MVHGLDVFRQYFLDFSDHYVIIGGTACTILLEAIGVDFRATHDVDLVLLAENMEPSFGETFWHFIEDGEYTKYQKATGVASFYRFMNPKNSEFPKMIELFSRDKEGSYTLNSQLMPIHFSHEIKSLSAILLDEVYYEALVQGRKIVQSLSVLNIETLILFKIKAWLDLRLRKNEGEFVPSTDINKHKNDIFRLLPNCAITPKMICHPQIEADIKDFLATITSELPILRDLGLGQYNVENLLNIIIKKFLH